jgi:hypothetical protein
MTPSPAPSQTRSVIPVGGVGTGGGGSLHMGGANMPLAAAGFAIMLAGAGSALWVTRRRRAGQPATAQPRR